MAILYLDKATIDNLRPRIPKDVYQTPVELAFESVRLVESLFPSKDLSSKIILDPGAGNGVWGEAVRRTYHSFRLTGVDIRKVKKNPIYKSWITRTNYLTWRPWNLMWDLVIGNPPFNLAEKFILHSRELLSEKGVLCFLLPSQFQHGRRRVRGLFREYVPEYIVSLAQRPNFTGPRGESLGTANTDDYILMIWTKGGNANPPKHLFLDWKGE